MFEHYTHESCKVIYFAREAALHAASAHIDSIHVLVGLLADTTSRANIVFRLRELFPEETARQASLKQFPTPKNVPLSNVSKRIFAYAAEEANRLNHYWIDTDHLVLGILREQECPGALMLNKVGLQIDAARSAVNSHPAPRKRHRYLSRLWRLKNPITPFSMQAGFLYLLGVVFLIEILTQRGCVLRFLLRK
jgi:ATP-dependent Clp protease ATP-binding subunit ClpC